MMRIVILLIAAVLFSFLTVSDCFAQEPPPMNCIPPDEGMADEDKAYIMSGVVLSGINLALAGFNSDRLGSGEATGGGAMGGMVFGLLGMGYGTVIIFSEEDLVSYTGLGTIIVGTVSFVYGLKAGGAVNRRNHTDRGRRLDLEPAVVRDGGGRLVPGLQLSWDF